MDQDRDNNRLWVRNGNNGINGAIPSVETYGRKANGFIVFIGLCFWLVPGVLYYIWIKSTPEKKKIIK